MCKGLSSNGGLWPCLGILLLTLACSRVSFQSNTDLSGFDRTGAKTQSDLIDIPIEDDLLDEGTPPGDATDIVDIPNYRFCRRHTHENDEEGVYHWLPETGSVDLNFGIGLVNKHYDVDDNFDARDMANLTAALNAPGAINGSLPRSYTSSGIPRFVDAEKEVIRIHLNKSKLDRLLASADRGTDAAFYIYDDRNGDGRFGGGDRLVSSSRSIPSRYSRRALAQANSNGFLFQSMTYLFMGAGRDCENIEDLEMRKICLEKCDATQSPLTIDLANNGYALTSVENGVQFDLEAIGKTQKVAWLKGNSDDALLVLDLNYNGLIDNGSELFGTSTKINGGRAANGFIALQKYDSNLDGRLSAGDLQFNRFQLWRDINHNGISEANELVPLASQIVSIDLNFTVTNTKLEHGNKIYAISTVKLVKDGITSIADIWFATE